MRFSTKYTYTLFGGKMTIANAMLIATPITGIMLGSSIPKCSNNEPIYSK